MTQKRTIITLFVLLVLVIAGAFGYFVWAQKSLTTLIAKQPANQQPLAKNETANWQTYKNDKYGFEVKYPPSLFYEIYNSSYTIFDSSHLDIIRDPRLNADIFLPVREFWKNNNFSQPQGDALFSVAFWDVNKEFFKSDHYAYFEITLIDKVTEEARNPKGFGPSGLNCKSVGNLLNTEKVAVAPKWNVDVVDICDRTSYIIHFLNSGLPKSVMEGILSTFKFTK